VASTLQSGSPRNHTNFRGLKVRNQVGTVVALLDVDTGDMCVAGQCYECWNPQTPVNSVFTVKASDGTVLAYLNSSGHLYMTGEVFDGI